jgi:hypothetical protein
MGLEDTSEIWFNQEKYMCTYAHAENLNLFMRREQTKAIERGVERPAIARSFTRILEEIPTAAAVHAMFLRLTPGKTGYKSRKPSEALRKCSYLRKCSSAAVGFPGLQENITFTFHLMCLNA